MPQKFGARPVPSGFWVALWLVGITLAQGKSRAGALLTRCWEKRELAIFLS